MVHLRRAAKDGKDKRRIIEDVTWTVRGVMRDVAAAWLVMWLRILRTRLYRRRIKRRLRNNLCEVICGVKFCV